MNIFSRQQLQHVRPVAGHAAAHRPVQHPSLQHPPEQHGAERVAWQHSFQHVPHDEHHGTERIPDIVSCRTG